MFDFKKYLDKIVAIPAILCSSDFITNLLAALADGKIDDKDFHAVLGATSFVELLPLWIAYYLIKRNSE